MLHAIAAKVKETGADVGLGFDGDGDRCGVVDNEGEEIFADKIGVMLARDLSKLHPGATFVVDVKSTGLYAADPELQSRAVQTDYWKTGHSYIKRRVNALGALAGFEKSGHFFFNEPVGRGYDDGLLTAIAVIEMLDRNPTQTMADLYRALPKTWGSPTMSPHCADEVKYGVVEAVTERFRSMQARGEPVAGQAITSLVTVNGVRITTEDGTWGLVRASSNKPELVVVVESPSPRRGCTRCSKPSTACCGSTRKWALTIRRSDVPRAASTVGYLPAAIERRCSAWALVSEKYFWASPNCTEGWQFGVQE